MPKHADGPPSGGYRYGSLNALRANLPTGAINPRGVVTEANARARQNLSSFADYYTRAKAIGKPLPAAQSISKRRAAVLRKIEELEQQEHAERSVTLVNGELKKLKLVFDTVGKSFHFIEEDLALGIARRSLLYGSKGQAMMYHRLNMIHWVERFSMP